MQAWLGTMPDGGDPLYSKYKAVRNRIRKYTSTSLIREALAVLHEAHVGGVEVIAKYQPWKVLLMVKWVLQEFDSLAHRRQAAGRNELHQVLNEVFLLEDEGLLPSQFRHPTLFLRQLAFQQFWLKWAPDAAALARQEALFTELPENHLFKRKFKEKTGLSIADFTLLSFALLTLVLHEPMPRTLKREDFAVADAALGRGALDAFLKYLGKSVQELSEWLGGENFQGIAVADQLILTTPLIEAPLLRGAGVYFIWYPSLLLWALKSVVYRTLRNADPTEFGNSFGRVFEDYLARCLTDAGVSHMREEHLIAALPGNGKCVDFVVLEGDCTVLIDAKAMEMSTLGRVARTAEAVVRAVKGSVVKAMVQGLAMDRRLKAGGHAVPVGTEETFLVVVTFGELYLGSNREFRSLFGENLVPRLERDFGAPLPVPIENMFFITVDEFERLLARVQAGQTTIVHALKFARSEDAGPRSKFIFQQHLDSLCKQDTQLQFLQSTFEGLIDRCRGKLFP